MCAAVEEGRCIRRLSPVGEGKVGRRVLECVARAVGVGVLALRGIAHHVAERSLEVGKAEVIGDGAVDVAVPKTSGCRTLRREQQGEREKERECLSQCVSRTSNKTSGARQCRSWRAPLEATVVTCLAHTPTIGRAGCFCRPACALAGSA